MDFALSLLGAAAAFAAQSQQQVANLPAFDTTPARVRAPQMGMTTEDNPAWQTFSREVLAQALSKYPPVGVARRLNAVYIVRLLWCNQSYYGGTSTEDHRGILLSVGMPGVDATWLSRSFHHEFAHILQDQAARRFPRKVWEKANAPGFHYTYGDSSGGYLSLTRGQVSEEFDPALNRQGILHTYGASTIEEDWACYSAYVLSDDANFWAMAARYERVRAKARLVEDFYRKAFPGIVLHEIGA